MNREYYIKKKFEEINIFLSEGQIRQFVKYYEMLIEKNNVMNLTAITEFEDVVEKHFVDSLSVILLDDMKQYKTMIDIGTGAGFPGLPIKIIYPHLNLILLDSLQKRILFLKEVAEELQLEQVTCIHGRAEDLAGKSELREKMDICVSRAVADLSVLSEYCLPFIRINGSFISYKSGSAGDEISKAVSAVELLGGKIAEKKVFTLPGTDISRILVKIDKKNQTPAKYPRKPGLIKKKPL